MTWIEKEWEAQQFLLRNKERSDKPAILASDRSGEDALMRANDEGEREATRPEAKGAKRKNRGKPQKRVGLTRDGLFLKDLQRQFKLNLNL